MSAVGECLALVAEARKALDKKPLDVPLKTVTNVEHESKSTIGLMLEGCTVTNLLPGGPALYSKQIHRGDIIVQVGEQDVDKNNVIDHLLHPDEPGTCVLLVVKKGEDGDPRQVMLRRVATPVFADKRHLFDAFTKIRDAFTKYHDRHQEAQPFNLFGGSPQKSPSKLAQLGEAGIHLVEEAIDVWAQMDFFADDRWHEAERNVKQMQDTCSAKIESIEKKLALLNTEQDRSNNGDTGAMQSQLAETQRQLAATKADLQHEQQMYMKSLDEKEMRLLKADQMVQAEKRRAEELAKQLEAEKRRAEELAKQLEDAKRANPEANPSSASASAAELQAVEDKLHRTEGELKHAQDRLHKMEGELKQAKQSAAERKDFQDKLHKMEGELKQAKQSEEHARKEVEQLRAEVTGAREGKDEISGRMKELESVNKQLRDQVKEQDGRVKEEMRNAQEAKAKAAAAVRAPERDARLQKQIKELEAELKKKDVQLQQVERQAGMTSAQLGKGREAQGGALQLVIAALLMLSFMTTLMVDRSAVLQLVL